jgi:hypothetical protein
MPARLRWLAAALACVAAGALAQSKGGKTPLDLQYRGTTQGTVAAIREVYASGKGPTPAAAQTSGSGSGPDEGMPVGAVAYWNFGPGSGDSMRVGTVGQGDMQNWVTDHATEIVVRMDDGERRTFRPRNPERFQIHARVTVQGGTIEPSDGKAR